MVHNIVSVSGGKDSTATLLLAIQREAKNMMAVFADTGHENPITYEYIDYLERETATPITRVKADFSSQIEGKRDYVNTKWREEGVDEKTIDAALSVLHPTGNPYLDLCIWKGRFPSSQSQFCTEELKITPIHDAVFWPILRQPGTTIESWQGIRWEESADRAKYVEREEAEPDAQRVFAYRPILAWTAGDVFAFHKRHGIKPNPLYSQGMGRVGCMPCVNCRKNELAEISSRFPEVIDKIRTWESIVSKAAKRQSATFFCTSNDPSLKGAVVNYLDHGIDSMVDWSMTTRGGRQYDLLRESKDTSACSSLYGLCE